MEEIVINIVEQFGCFGVFFLIAIENIFPPIPSEAILTFSGFMTTHTSLNIIAVIIFATLGSLCGAVILYYIGKLLNKERLIKIVSGRVGKILRLKSTDIEKANYWFNNKGHITVFFCRFIPILRSLISIPAGINNMPMKKFLIYTSAGSVIWNTILVILGSIMGEKWVLIVSVMNSYSYAILTILIILFVIMFGYFYYKKNYN